MKRAGSRADFFNDCSRGRTSAFETNFAEVAARYVDTSKISADAPLFDFEEAFWRQLAADLSVSDPWTMPLHDARAAALAKAAVAYFGLAESSPNYYDADSVEDTLFVDAKRTLWRPDSNDLFCGNFNWNSLDEVSNAVGGTDLRLQLAVASSAQNRKLGVALGAAETFQYSALDIGGTDFQFDVLLKVPTLDGESHYAVAQDPNEQAGAYGLLITDGNILAFSVLTDGGVLTAMKLSGAVDSGDELEVKVTGVWADNEIKLYVNGVLEHTVAWNDAISSNSGDFYVGGVETFYWKGSVFGVRISNTVR